MKIRITYIKIILLSFLILSCKKESKFFNLQSEKTINNGSTYEHIVISHPSKNIDSLYLSIIKYSKSELKICEELRKGFKVNYFFYKETRETPRDFVSTDDDCNFDSKYIGCQTDDIICVLKSKNYKKEQLVLKLRKNVDSNWKEFPFELDCNK